MARYRVLQGIDYPPNKRAEAGKVVDDLPATSVKWLLESGIIEDADKPTNKSQEPVVEEPKVEPVAEKVEEPIVEEVFDPNAEDIDGDGFVQDGTPHQRPVEEK
jgi:hypothetical protein